MPRCIAPWRVTTLASSSKVALSIGQSASALPIAAIRKGSRVSLGWSPRSRFIIARVSSSAVTSNSSTKVKCGMRRFGLLHILGDLAAQADDLDRLVGALGACRACGDAAAVVEKIGVEVGVADAVGRWSSPRRGRCRGRGRAGATAGEARTLRPCAARWSGLRRDCRLRPWTGRSPSPAARLVALPHAGGGASVAVGRNRFFASALVGSTAPSASGLLALSAGSLRPRSRSRPAPSRSRSGRRLRRRASTTLPATGDSISTVALSVIMSASCWSSSTRSPTLTCQATISASAMPSPMSGSLNSKVAISPPSLSRARLEPLRAGEIGPFIGVRIGRVPAGDALDRRFEMIEAALLDQARRARRRSPRCASLPGRPGSGRFSRPIARSPRCRAGRSVRRSMTSASTPFSSTAASATWTIVP